MTRPWSARVASLGVAGLILVLLQGMTAASAGGRAVRPEATPTIPLPIGRPGSPSPSPTPTPTPRSNPQKDRAEERRDPSRADPLRASTRKVVNPGVERRRPRDSKKNALDKVLARYRPTGGVFGTSSLVAQEAQLRAFGWQGRKLSAVIYRPFIIGGYAEWTDSWGAPRFGPAPGQIRSHEGQDVFCPEGTPVLATERGRVEFASGGLGGRIARVYRFDGSYWYYAHLKDWNTDVIQSGDRVEPGDVIGFCGNSGNAVGSPAHVHFGWYRNGIASNPLSELKGWLERAVSRARRTVQRVTRGRVAQTSMLTSFRRFGDAFAPDQTDTPAAVALNSWITFFAISPREASSMYELAYVDA